MVRAMVCCMLFMTNFNLFCMQHDDEKTCDSTSIAVPVAAQSQDESHGKRAGLPVNLALQPGCCAICYEPIDDSIVRQALACCHERERKIQCSTCTAIYHRTCLEKFFSISSSAEARAQQCPSRCGTELISLPCSQRLARWCRKNLLMFDVLISSGVVAISLVSKYSPPAMYVCLGLTIIVLIAALRGLIFFAAEIYRVSDLEQYTELLTEAKKLFGVACIGMVAIVGGLLFRYLVLE